MRKQLWLCGVVAVSTIVAGAQTPQTPHQRLQPVASVKAAPGQAAIEHRFLKPDARPLPGFPGVTPGSKAIDARRQHAAMIAQRSARPAPVPSFSPRSFSSSPSQVMPGLEMRPYLNGGSYPSAVATGDFDHDGHLDFVVANAGSNDLWLYRGNGDNTFKTPSVIPLTKGSNPIYVAAADLRGSGNLDLVVAEYGSFTIGVLLNNGDGTFGIEQEYTLPDPPGAVTIADFNRDGKLDIAAGLMDMDVHQTPGGIPWIAMLAGNGDGTFQNATLSNNSFGVSEASDIDSADVNGDGLPDLLITNPNLLQSTIYFNNGDGTFAQGPDILAPGERWGPMDGRLADINGDGCPDVVVPELLEWVIIATGDCAGHFNNKIYVPVPQGNTALRLADVNGDGHPDIVTSSIITTNVFGDIYSAGNTLAVSYGDGKGNFGAAHMYTGNSESLFLALGDFKGNGYPSVITADADSDTVSLYFNDATGDLGFPEGGVPTQLAPNDYANGYTGYTFADLNKDGKPDMYQVGVYGNQLASLVSLNDGRGHLGTDKVSPLNLVPNGGALWDYRLADFRNTGNLDLILLEGQNLVFQPGNGDGTFGQGSLLANVLSGSQGLNSVAVADFDKDGKLDLVVATNDVSNNHIITPYLGNGDGTFRTGAPVQFSDQNAYITRIFTGDYNRDGKQDVLVFTTANGYWTPTNSVWEFLGNGDGTLQPGRQLYSTFQPMAMADINGDGSPDIVRYDIQWPDGTTETFQPPKFTNYLGQPDGTFLQSSSYSPYAGYPQSLIPYLESGDPLNGYLVADYSGDGKLDEAAIFRPPGLLTAAFLAGNGDGTFVPTYDYFPFSVYYFPIWQHDLNGDGFSDMVQMDSATGAITVYRGAPAPAFQMALESNEVSGSGCGYVWPNLVSSSDRSIGFISSPAGITLPSTLTLPAGATAAKFCFTIDPGYDSHQAFAITATLDGYSQTVYGAVAYTHGFRESLSATTTSPAYLGQSAPPVTVTITAQPGYTGAVQLGCAQLLPKWSCEISPSALSLTPGSSASASIVVTSDSSVPNAGNPIFITAGDGTDAEMLPLAADFVQLGLWPMGPSPATLWDASPGTSGSTMFAYNAIGTPSFSCSGLPAGSACNFVNTDGTNLTNMSVTIPAGVQSGNIPFNVNIASQTYTASMPAVLQVFSINLAAPSTTPQGFAGSTVQVTFPFQQSNLPPNRVIYLACTIDFLNCTQTSFALINSTTNQLVIYMGVPASLQAGAHQLAITTTTLGFPQTFNFPFNVVDFSGSLNTTSVTMKPGGSASVTVTVTPAGGLTGSVQLSCFTSAPIACSFVPAAAQLGGGSGQSTLTLSAATTARSGDAPLAFSHWPVLAVLLPVPLIGFRRRRRLLALTVLLVAFLPLFSCGGGGATSNTGGGGTPPPSNYTVHVSGTSGGVTRDMGSINVTVNH
jgi:hypothetical protein